MYTHQRHNKGEEQLPQALCQGGVHSHLLLLMVVSKEGLPAEAALHPCSFCLVVKERGCKGPEPPPLRRAQKYHVMLLLQVLGLLGMPLAHVCTHMHAHMYTL